MQIIYVENYIIYYVKSLGNISILKIHIIYVENLDNMCEDFR